MSNPSKIPTIQNRTIKAILAILPLSLSVVPWGILCGTLSIEAGLSNFQAQLMSLLIFAGAAQLAGIAILGMSGSWMSLINSTAMISVRHVLYSATYKDIITPLPLYKRLLFAFMLTDEMFVVAQADQIKTGYFDYHYALTAGTTFYIIWNLSSFVGIVSAHLLTDIESLGFDFAIAATFIAMVIPMIKNKVLVVAVLASAVSAYVFEALQVSNGLVFSALIGMVIGAILSSFEDNDDNMPLTDNSTNHSDASEDIDVDTAVNFNTDTDVETQKDSSIDSTINNKETSQ